MKLTTFILMIALAQVSAATFAQKLTYIKQGASLQEVFKQIKTQTGYNVLYSPDQIDVLKKVNVNFKQTDLKEVLNKLIDDETQEYAIVDNNILIKQKELSFLDRASSAIRSLSKDLFQSINVRGRVLDSETGNALEGATVKVKGTSRTTTTNYKGEFFLSGVDEDAVIMVNFIGYKVLEVKAVGNVGDLRMEVLAAELKEVAISTGYQQISPERFVGSATVVDSTLLQRGTSSDILSRLDGITNGLLFNKSNNILQLQLRGISTLSSSANISGQSAVNPLIILDDFPYNGELNNINPNDVESITVLKDAAATSIWGARAGNGAIVITTKKGSYNNKMSINFNSNLMIQSKPDLQYFPTMSSNDFIDVEQFLFDKGFHSSYLPFPTFYTISPAVEIMDRNARGLISDMEAETRLNALRKLDVRDDYDHYVFRNALNKQNYLGISGGTGTLKYNLSLGADNNLTSIKGPGSDNRYTINSIFTIKPIKAAEVTAGINYVNEVQKSDGIGTRIVPGGGRSALYPYAQLADDQGNHLAIPYLYAISHIDTLAPGKLLDWHYRPLDEMNFVNKVNKKQLLRLNLSTKFSVTQWFNIDLKYQYVKQSSNIRDFNDLETFFTRNLINSYTVPNTFKRNIPVGGILDDASRDLTNHSLRSQLNIAKNWSGLHDFTCILAGEFGTGNLNSKSMRIYGYNDEILSYATNTDYFTRLPLFFGRTATIPNNLILTEQDDRFISFVANASYAYDSRYSVYVSGRRDGSNLFGVRTNNKWKPLWSVGGRWNLSNEALYNASWLPTLSIRASYGYSGNVNNTISALSTIAYASFQNEYGQSYAFINTPPNPDLRWEEVRTLNIGLDYGFRNNRIGGSLEWYKKKAVDVISNIPVDPTIGVSKVDKNAANLKGDGFDFRINTRNLVEKFIWNSSINVSYSKTVVSEYFQEFVSTPLTPSIKKGEILGGLYAYKWGGLDPQSGDPIGFVGRETSKNYKAIFIDSATNQIYKGSPFPLFFGNLLNSFSYKRIELSFNISFRSNYYFRKPSIRYDRLFRSWEGHADYEKRWKSPGDELYTNVPSMPYPFNSDRDQFYEYSEINIEKGNNIRLQDARVSYNWINHHYPNFPIKNAQLYLYAGNLNILLWKASKSGYDPDYPTSQIPPSKDLSLGIRINF